MTPNFRSSMFILSE